MNEYSGDKKGQQSQKQKKQDSNADEGQFIKFSDTEGTSGDSGSKKSAGWLDWLIKDPEDEAVNVPETPETLEKKVVFSSIKNYTVETVCYSDPQEPEHYQCIRRKTTTEDGDKVTKEETYRIPKDLLYAYIEKDSAGKSETQKGVISHVSTAADIAGEIFEDYEDNIKLVKETVEEVNTVMKETLQGNEDKIETTQGPSEPEKSEIDQRILINQQLPVSSVPIPAVNIFPTSNLTISPPQEPYQTILTGSSPPLATSSDGNSVQSTPDSHHTSQSTPHSARSPAQPSTPTTPSPPAFD